MRILFYGDLQINRRRPEYMQQLKNCMTHLRETIRERAPDLVVNLGDVMDTKSLVDVEDLVWGYYQMREIAGVSKEHYILKGNHDLSDRKGEYASVQVMDSDSRVFMNPEYVEYKNGTNILVLPYTEDIDSTYKWLSDFNPDLDLIIGHVDWIGCRLTPAYVSKSGFDQSWFQRIWRDVPIFNGHYHHPMDVGNLHLVGSPLHKDFNDVLGTIERGYTLWDSSTGHVERITNPHTYYCLQLTYESMEALEHGWRQLREMAGILRVKVFVSNELLDDAKEMFGGFLWSSIIPLDSSAIRMEHTSQLNLQSTPSEVLKKGVDAAPGDYDKATLYALGQKAFAV